jgi:hypothetical protein
MATITGLTADRMLEIEAASVVDGDVVNGELILTKHDGSSVNAGSVIGPPGPEGPMGSDTDVLVEQIIHNSGTPGQLRAGRPLTPDDFLNVGLETPLALWNFSNNGHDLSGNGHNLVEKGVPRYVRGIDGADATAVQFDGANAFYISDTGASDPFRLKVGTFAGWFRSAKQGVLQSIVTKRGLSGTYAYWLRINASNVASFGISATGAAPILEVLGSAQLCDYRWHFLVGTYDGITQNLYVDGKLDATAVRGSAGAEYIFASSSPLNVGAFGADASTAVAESNFGQVDEVFMTSEILSPDDVFNLYCVKIPHTLGIIPSGISLNVYPGAKGGSLFTGDFPTMPLRLYNFSAGSLANEGSNPSSGLTVVGTPISVPGVDGAKGNAYGLSGAQRFTASDAGLPAGVVNVSYGCWFKSSASVAGYLIAWGTTQGTNDNRIYIVAAGNITFANGSGSGIVGPFVADGLWHFVVAVHEVSPTDGLKRKFYLDGQLVASSPALNAVVLGGANKFVIGSSLTSTNNLIGQVDTAFVCDSVLTLDDINNLYTKNVYEHLPSPKNPEDYVQAMSDTDLYVIFDTLGISDKISMKVMA